MLFLLHATQIVSAVIKAEIIKTFVHKIVPGREPALTQGCSPVESSFLSRDSCDRQERYSSGHRSREDSLIRITHIHPARTTGNKWRTPLTV